MLVRLAADALQRLLKFSQLLRKSGQLTDLVIPLSTAKYSSTPVEKISIDASIESTAEMKSVYNDSAYAEARTALTADLARLKLELKVPVELPPTVYGNQPLK